MNFDSSNKFLVGARGETVMVMSGVGLGGFSARIAMTKEDALNLAAWLSVIADPSGEEFARLVAEIRRQPAAKSEVTHGDTSPPSGK